MREYRQPKKTIPRVPEGHQGDWIRACKEGKNGRAASSNFSYGGSLTEMVLLGTVAIRNRDTVLKWDSVKAEFTNNENANNMLKSNYRKGWTL